MLAQRRKPATVNDLLFGGLAIAILRVNSGRGTSTGRVSVMNTGNLRPPEWAEEIVANILSFVSVSVLASEQSDLASP